MELAGILMCISFGILTGYFFYCYLGLSALHTFLAGSLIAVLILKLGA